MGHEGRGAVTAALATKFAGAAQKSRIAVLLENILPALKNLDASKTAGALLRSAVEGNVRHTVRELSRTPEARARLRDRRFKLVGAVYALETGKVRFLELISA